jgi:hypothetical protein
VTDHKHSGTAEVVEGIEVQERGNYYISSQPEAQSFYQATFSSDVMRAMKLLAHLNLGVVRSRAKLLA